jgi:hypothetical protein
MNTNALKVFAEHLRNYFTANNHSLKHNEALDLIAAIPGLRNWPEVNALPTLVDAAQLDHRALERLSKRLHNKRSIDLSTVELQQILTPLIPVTPKLHVWPEGPKAGIYVTTEQSAIEMAVARYEAATNGALLYAELACRSAKSVINLGEYGLFSQGMDRLPSGTLIVVGPLQLSQEQWSDSKNRLNTAADLAYTTELRIVVLVETPSPKNMHSDIELLLRSEDEGPEIKSIDTLGIVTEAGELKVLTPFVQQRKLASTTSPFSTSQKLPGILESALKQAIAIRPFGIIALGANLLERHRLPLLGAIIPLTEHAGPIALIQSKIHADYGKKDDTFYTLFKGMEVFPSIESAYEHGFRRMIIESAYHSGLEVMLKYAHDACFILSTFSSEVVGIWLDVIDRHQNIAHGLQAIIALLGVTYLYDRREETFSFDSTIGVCDAIVAGTPMPPNNADMIQYIEDNRIILQQEHLKALLVAGEVTVEQARKYFPHNDLEIYLSSSKLLEIEKM